MDNPSSRTAILGTGLFGLVGSTFVEAFADKYDCTNLDLLSGVDITDETQVMKAAEASAADAIIHCAAFVDVNRAWEEKGNKNGLTYKVNVLGTQNIVNAAAKFHKHVIHISTAYVFDGEKDSMYVEDDAIHPVEWYGETKAMAEEVVKNGGASWTILRIDQPFRKTAFGKKADSARKIIQGLQSGKLYPQFVDHWFAPTYLDDFAQVLDWAVQKKPNGIYHATVNQKVTDFEFAQKLSTALSLPAEIKEGHLADYLKTLQRPYQRNTALSSEKLFKESGLKLHTLDEAVSSIVI
ncbi:MAG TPA: sugar nucleotide-binding protein [Candidatus Saccharimonadia bacterium]|nr:sugar nucleotide-binding protein [Candidatus Saccharimonadia bacterium]